MRSTRTNGQVECPYCKEPFSPTNERQITCPACDQRWSNYRIENARQRRVDERNSRIYLGIAGVIGLLIIWMIATRQ